MDDSLFFRTNKEKNLLSENMQKAEDVKKKGVHEFDELQHNRMKLEDVNTDRSFVEAPVFSKLKIMQRPVVEDIVQVNERAAQRIAYEVDVSFSKACRGIERKDSQYMRSIKQEINKYFGYSEYLKLWDNKILTKQNIADKITAMESAMESLYRLQKDCSTYISKRWYKFFSSRKTRVQTVKENAEREYAKLRLDYVDLMDIARRKNVVVSRKTEEHAEYTMDKKGNMIFAERELLDASDRGFFASKNYLKMRTEKDKDTDEKNNGAFFNENEKALLNKIEEYASIKSTSELYRKKGYKKSIRNEIRREAVLVNEIREGLTQVLASETTEDVKKRFRAYKEHFDTFQNGKLQIEENAQVLDYSGANIRYYRSVVNKDKKSATQKSTTITDKSNEPLFAHEPCVADITQTNMRNCYILSALVQLVTMGSDQIKNMMREEGGKVTVRFYKQNEDDTYSPVYIKVDKKVDADSNAETLWVQIVNKAYSVYRQNFQKPEPGTVSILSDLFFRDVYHNNVPADVVDFGFVANGGYSNVMLNTFLGSRYRRSRVFRTGLYNVSEDSEMLKYSYQTSFSLARQKRRARSGELFNDKFASIFRSPVHLLYFKDAHKEAMDTAPDKVQSLFDTFGRYEVMFGDDRKLVPAGMNFLTNDIGIWLFNRTGDPKTIEYVGELLINKQNMDERKKQLAQQGLQLIRANYNTTFQSEETFKYISLTLKATMNHVKKMTLDEFLDKLRMDAIKGKFTELTGHEFGINENIFDHLQPEKIEQTIRLARTYVLLLTEQCITAMEAKSRRRTSNHDRVYEQVKDMDLQTYLQDEDETSERGSLNKLALAIEGTTEQAFSMVKKAVKAKHECYTELKDRKFSDVEKKKRTIFTGFYTAEALDVYENIKSALTKSDTVMTGTQKKSLDQNLKDKEQGIINGHAYSILGTQDIEFHGKTIHMIKLRNPWGETGVSYKWDNKAKKMTAHRSSNGGTFFMELTHYMKMFALVTT